jgi:hypothetical protein
VLRAEAQILQQKRAHIRPRLDGGKGGVGLPSGKRSGQWDGLHRLGQPCVAVLVYHRCDVGNHEAADPVGVQQCQSHRRLAAHRVPNHRGLRDIQRVECFSQVLGLRRVAHVRSVRAVAVVSHIQRNDMETGCEGAPDRPEVPAGAKQAVQQNDRLSLARLDSVQKHVFA